MSNKKGAADTTTSIMNTNEVKVVDIHNNNPRVRPGFNTQGTINLDEFDKLVKSSGLVPIKFKSCTFSHFEFLDLHTVDLDDENFANLGIRNEFDANDRIDGLEVSFSQRGFVITEWPPSRDSNGAWLGGRGRASAAINNDERWLPTAVYSREDTSLKNTLTNAFIENLDDLPNSPATYEDIVNGGVHLINLGELEPTVADIDSWLRDLQVELHFKTGQITKMRDKIIEVSTRDESLILRKATKDWHSWIKRNLELRKKDYVLVNASLASCDTYIQRVWCETILPAIIKGTDPVDIIFYTSLYRPPEAREALSKSITKLNQLYAMSYELVKSQLAAAGLNLDGLLKATGKSIGDAEKPFNIIGACPQIADSHDLESDSLVSVAKY
ncbi:MAG TPA: hypothetical protein EYN67_08705 [Flavobacteriales bacterium]|nr:hypothetical protein [Flavobacteriales bacterium]